MMAEISEVMDRYFETQVEKIGSSHSRMEGGCENVLKRKLLSFTFSLPFFSFLFRLLCFANSSPGFFSSFPSILFGHPGVGEFSKTYQEKSQDPMKHIPEFSRQFETKIEAGKKHFTPNLIVCFFPRSTDLSIR